MSNNDSNFIEVYEVEDGRGRHGYSYKDGAIEFLPEGSPLPCVGDILLLPRNLACESDEQAFVMKGALAPFRVVERESLYFRSPSEEHDPHDTKPARYLKTWVFVRRLSKEEYGQDPGTL